MEKITKQIIIDFINESSALMDENKDYLIELDGAIGDGDLGLTMSAGFGEAKKFVTSSSETDIGKFLYQIGMVFAKAVPSTMGTLVASAFMKSGKALKGSEEITIEGLDTFAQEFVKGIMERGKAEIGGRTIIDSIHPASIAISKACSENKNLIQCCEAAFVAAQKGVVDTESMMPTFGRAVYFGEKALGKPDQGAVVGMLIFKALYKSVSQ